MLFFLLIVIARTHAQRNEIINGPYLQNAAKDKITVMWETSKRTESRVEYGLTQDYDMSQVDPTLVRIHEVTLTSLEPETKYYYRVSCGTQIRSSTFITGVHEETPFSFVVYGDSFKHPDKHRQIAKGLSAAKPNFIIHTGDLVGGGFRLATWDKQFFWPLFDVIDHIPFFPCLGNHENSRKNYSNFFSLPNNELYYSFDYGNSHFVVLDSNIEYKPDSEQYAWLEEDLRASDKFWKFVVFHHPPYSSGRHKSSLKIRDAWTPLFRKYKVDTVFNGHDHIYERTYPIASVLSEDKHPITYVVTGGGGASLYNIEKRIWTANSTSVYHFCVVEIRGESLFLTSISIDGQIIDRFSMQKRNGEYSEKYLARIVPSEQIEFERQLLATKPPDFGLLDNTRAISEDASIQIENTSFDSVSIRVFWETHNWQVTPTSLQVCLEKDDVIDIPFTFKTKNIYPAPTFTISYQNRLGKGAIKCKPIKVGVRKELKCKYVYKSPVLDGRLRETSWQQAKKGSEFIHSDLQDLADSRTTARTIYGDSALYLAFVCFGELPQKFHSKRRGESEEPIANDIVAVFIAPEGEDGTMYRFAFNHLGVKYDAKNGKTKWDGRWRVAIKINRQNWIAEVKIPYATLGLLTPPQPGEKWRINFRRNNQEETEKSYWSPVLSDTISAEMLGVLVFL